MNKYRFAEPQKMLSELLAVIHRDGGQYEWEHGTARAVEDAEKIVQNLRFGPLFDTRSTAHIDRSGETVHFTGGADDALKSADLGNRRWVPNCRCVIAPVVDPRDEFEAEYAATARPRMTVEYLRMCRNELGGYLPDLHFLNGAWLGWKLAKGLP